ncbi:hypothetical protein L2E82_27762 [Cichorium intybus]|uniref:Uncharacterized protein n=1 Tax=Cichorium intybus TaxID=13427 RepID=A0ACB9CU69_CICIN|nr:hypothetical protein L2E82_27762 [Cichorium intybus]
MLPLRHNRSFVLARRTFGHQKRRKPALGVAPNCRIMFFNPVGERDKEERSGRHGGGNAQKSKMAYEKNLEKAKAAGEGLNLFEYHVKFFSIKDCRNKDGNFKVSTFVRLNICRICSWKGCQPASKIYKDSMPYTRSLLVNKMALGYHAKAAAPTVILPRLKAMTTGLIGGFLNVLFNFNTQALLEDNIIGQLFRIGWKMVMLGDETWLNYPGGLASYINTARELLAYSKAGKNPYDGFAPSAIPAALGVSVMKEYHVNSVSIPRKANSLLQGLLIQMVHFVE